jgi:hypothetical protein
MGFNLNSEGQDVGPQGSPPSRLGGLRLFVLALSVTVLVGLCLMAPTLLFLRNRLPLLAVPTQESALAPVSRATVLSTPERIDTSTPVPSATPPLPSDTPLIPLVNATGQGDTACKESLLFLGERVFRIELLKPSADGSVTLPASEPGLAYVLDGSQPDYAFVLNDAPENLALLDTLKLDDKVSILWVGCQLEEPKILALNHSDNGQALNFRQSTGGITVFVQEQAAVVAAETAQPAAPIQASTTPPAEVQPSATINVPGQPTSTRPPASTATPASTPIPPPSATDIEAEIGFLGKQVTAATITVNISVYNYGAKAFSITVADAHLQPPGQSPVYPSSVDPALPYLIESGGRRDFTFTFPNPGGSGIVFQLFNVEYNLDDF